MIPVNEPLFISNEEKYLAECIKSGWISSEGPFVKEFEGEIASYVGRKYAIAVSSGTAALEIAVGSISLKPGEEVIMPTFTIISCAMAVVAYGGVPVFVDAEPHTWNMDVDKIEEKITKKTRAIMVVHIYGHPSDMDPIIRIAKKYNLSVIEDTAEAHGAEYRGKKCGAFGNISCFSFYANKIITCGEGGMLVTNNKRLAKRARFLRNLGFIRKRRFYHNELARNYRITNLQAAVGVAQAKNIAKLIKIKIENASIYTERLKDVRGLQLPIEKEGVKNVYWMYSIVLSRQSGFDAGSFANSLAKNGIASRPFFYPLHLQPALRKINIKPRGDFPVAEKISRQGLYLPSGLALRKKQINKICRTVKELLT